MGTGHRTWHLTILHGNKGRIMVWEPSKTLEYTNWTMVCALWCVQQGKAIAKAVVAVIELESHLHLKLPDDFTEK